jgi:ferredoxin-NADP reductase/MOSC domain-containing protein YiiM
LSFSPVPAARAAAAARPRGGIARAGGEVVSVNVGRPRAVRWRGREVCTGIFKRPVRGRVGVGPCNLEGDGQADLVNHGGELKAVYAYPREHYPFWRSQLGALPGGWGVFGENLTVAGLLEDEVCVGDLIAVGSARLRVTEPRYPCFKLGIRLGRDDIVDRFVHANRPGFYLAVEREGALRAGEAIGVVEPHPDRLSVAELMRLRALSGPEDADALRAALEVDALTGEWRGHLARRLEALACARPAPAWPGLRRFRVTARRPQAAGVEAFTLEPTDGGPLAGYRPGQFVAVELPAPAGPAAVRCYSLCDAPGARALRIAVKRLAPAPDGDGGVSARLHDQLEEGHELWLRAPAGAFVADPRTPRPLVLVAGGIGVTPVHAITAAVAAGQLERDTFVFYAARRPGEDPFAGSLRALASASERIELRLVYSRHRPDPDDPVARGPARVDAEMVIDATGTAEVDVLVCGPEGMVCELPAALRAAGVAAERIGVEAFGPAAARALAAPVAVPPGGLAVRFARSRHTARWRRADQTLLELAEASGVPLGFSCRSGSCGSCAVSVRGGEVAYLRPPAATVPEGECLTCIAVPQTDLELEA